MGRSPVLEEILEQWGAQWFRDDGVDVAEHYGDPDGEYAALQKGALGIIERGERETLVIHGEDAVPWLQGLVTSDLHELVEEGSGQRTAFVNTTGRFVGEARVLHLPELLVLDLEAGTLGGGLLGHLRQHIILEKVHLDDRSDATARLGLYGSDAGEAVEELARWEHDVADLPVFGGTWGRWRGEDLIVQRVRWTEFDSFEISCDVTVAADLMEELVDGDRKACLFGARTFEQLRIEAGVPRFGVELHDRVIPLEAGFEDAISFEKGCYLGQEIIARLDTLGTPAKLLRRVVLDTEQVPDAGAEVFPVDGDRKIGHVESATLSPRFDSACALAFVKRGHNDVGETVMISDARGRIEPIMDLTQ